MPEGGAYNEFHPFMGYDPRLDRIVAAPAEATEEVDRGPEAFTMADNWDGGFYELALELGGTDDKRMGQALSVLWEAAGVQGCYGSHSTEPSGQAEVSCTLESLERFGHLRGTVCLPSGIRVVCGVVAIREDEGSDWLDFYLPLGALSRADARIGGYPFEPSEGGSLRWRQPIDDWLAGVGRKVFDTVGFQLGMVGFEVSGTTSAAQSGGEPESPRYEAFLVPDAGELRYLPAER